MNKTLDDLSTGKFQKFKESKGQITHHWKKEARFSARERANKARNRILTGRMPIDILLAVLSVRSY